MNKISSLSDYLSRTPFDLDRKVAWLNDGWLTLGDLVSDVNYFHNEFRASSEVNWGLHLSNSYEFLVVLLALLHSKKTVMLLPNAQPGFLASIEHEMEVLVSDSYVDGLKLRQWQYKQDHSASNNTAALEDLDSRESKVVLFTSGSTGEPKKILKRLYQLDREIESLEAAWGNQLVGAKVISTVSHQHIYGLLFRLLWPLCSGRPFIVEQLHEPEHISAQIKFHKHAVLVSSPAHLSRIPKMTDLSQLSGNLISVYSSGGPLSHKASRRIHSDCGIAVNEIFGSSETGGVAYRMQERDDVESCWRPFSCVEIATNDESSQLQIRSPYLEDNEWYVMSDLVDIHTNGTFSLRGRSDKIVKVEEKRLSIPEMESRLCSDDLVEECAVLLTSGNRDTIAAVVVLSDKGVSHLADVNTTELKKTLKSRLSQYFEAVLLPRKWRFVEEIPVNTQGKRINSELEGLFAGGEKAGVERKSLPDVIELTKDTDRIQVELYIRPDLHYFSGHFPGDPILPGVIQVDWVMSFSVEAFKIPEDIQAMEVLKFRKIIQPGDKVILTINYNRDMNKLAFSYDSLKGCHSSGRLVLV